MKKLKIVSRILLSYLSTLALLFLCESCENNTKPHETSFTKQTSLDSQLYEIDSSLTLKIHEIDLGRLKFTIDLPSSLYQNNSNWGHSDFCYIGHCFSDSTGTEFTNLVYYYSYPERNIDFRNSDEYRVYVRQNEFFKLFNQEEISYNGRKCYLHEYYYSIEGQYYYGFFSHILEDEAGIQIQFRYTKKGSYNEASRNIARQCFNSFQVTEIDTLKPRIGVSL